jgi:hypothetical protein
VLTLVVALIPVIGAYGYGRDAGFSRLVSLSAGALVVLALVLLWFGGARVQRKR